MAAPATMVRLPRASPATAIRPRRNGRTIHPTQHSPSSTASVALCEAAAKAVRANSEHFSVFDAVVRTRARLIANSRNGWARPSTRRVSCRIHSVASACIPRLIQNA